MKLDSLSFIEGGPDHIGTRSLRSKSGKKAKNKGSSFERKIAKIMGDWWDSKFYRTPMSGGSQLRHDYNLAGDLRTPAEDFPFHIECKNQEALGKFHGFLYSKKSAVWKWWDQCVSECPDGQIPMLIFTKNHAPNFVMLPQNVWDKLSSSITVDVDTPSFVIRVDSVVVVALETVIGINKDIICKCLDRY